MQAYEFQAGCASFSGLHRVERPIPSLSPCDVLVKVRAASINSRDQAILAGRYFGGNVARNVIPLSDGAGEIIDVGPDVTLFRCGDRVAGTFFQGWVDGAPPASRAALGNPLDGMLAEYVALPEDGVVNIPNCLSYEEASALPCSAVTAWNALHRTGRPVRPGDTVLCLGTGGVSMAALVFAKQAGARAIVTSSSDAKLEKARRLGADEGLNYGVCPEWGKELSSRGIDLIVEVGGAGTLRKSLQAVAAGGKIALIGALTGLTGNLNWFDFMSKNASLHGVSVGPRQMFEEMNEVIESHGVRPAIDIVFPFDAAIEAFRHHAGGTFVGKVVIAL